MNGQILDNIVKIVQIILLITGPLVAYLFGLRQSRRALVRQADYEVYKATLGSVNQVLTRAGNLQAGLNSHTQNVARILNGITSTDSGAERKKSLVDEWAEETKTMLDTAYAFELEIVEFERALDTNGAGFDRNSPVYKALDVLKVDMANQLRKTINRFSSLELNATSVKQYEWLNEEVADLNNRVNEFSNCVEDVLIHAYNQLVAENFGKRKKQIDTTIKRRMITPAGLKDTRAE